MEDELLLKISGERYDAAIAGIATVWQTNERVGTIIYDGLKLIDILLEEDGMTYEEAVEYITYNIEGAYVGKSTPIIMWEYDE